MRAQNGNTWRKQVSIFHQNLEGRTDPKDQINETEILLAKLLPDLLFISEVDTETLAAWDFPGYKVHKGSLPGGRLTRLTAIVRSSLPHEVTYLDCEVPHAVVNFKINNKQFRCTGVYREWNFGGDHSTKPEQALRWVGFEDAWLGNNKRCNNSILIGDMNYCYLRRNSTHQQSLEPIRTSVRDNIVLRGWTQLIGKNTRHRGSQEPACLDHIYVNNPQSIKYSVNKPYTSSDHNCVGAVIKTQRYILGNEEFISRCWGSVNWNWGRYLVRYSSHFYKIFRHKDPNSILDAIEVELRTIMDTIAPEQLVKIKPGQQRWMTKHIKEQLEYRDKLKQVWHKSGLPADERKWKEVRTEVRFKVRRAKESQVEAELEVKDLKKRWKRINRITGGSDTNTGPPTELVHEGNTYIDPTNIANLLSEGFKGKVDGIMERCKADPVEAMRLFEPYAKRLEAKHGKFKGFDFREVDCGEVRKACMSLNNTPSLGTDKIPTILIKQLSRELAPYLCFLINQIIRTGIFPDRWRQGLISPIFKNSGSRTVRTNFRPVTITNALSKVFERIIDNQMRMYWWRHGIIDSSQHAYQAGKGTTSYWIDLMTKICYAKDSGKKASLSVFDLSSAFNMIQLSILRPKLLRIGFSEAATSLVAQTMTDRRLRVKIEDKLSEEVVTSTGSAEGGLTSPGAFIFYLCDIAEVKYRVLEAGEKGVKTEAARLAIKAGEPSSNPETRELIIAPNAGCEGGGYADDNGWVCSADTEDQLRAMAWELDDHVMHYFSVQGMAANSKKTEIVSLLNRFTRPIVVNEVKSQEVIKLLGIRMNSKLSFMAQAEEVCRKISNKLPSVVRLRGWASKNLLIKTADSLLGSHIRYLLEIWAGEARVVNLLQKAQNRMMRAILGKELLDKMPVAEMLKELNWINIPCQVAYRSLYWIRRVDREAMSKYTWSLLYTGQQKIITRHWRLDAPFVSKSHATSNQFLVRALYWYNRFQFYPDCIEFDEYKELALSRVIAALGNGNV